MLNYGLLFKNLNIQGLILVPEYLNITDRDVSFGNQPSVEEYQPSMEEYQPSMEEYLGVLVQIPCTKSRLYIKSSV